MAALTPRTAEFRLVALAGTLRTSQIFSGLPEADLMEIAKFVQTRMLGKNEHLFYEGDPAEGFYLLQRGSINVHRLSASGREQVICIFRPGDTFAEAALASVTGYPANARAIEPSTVLVVPKKEFLALLSKRPDLALRMLGSMSMHLRVLVGLLDDLTLKDMESRLANWLLKRCPKPLRNEPAVVKLGMTKRVIAAELGTTAETLSRTLARYREEGVLAVQGSTITVKSPTKLAARLRHNLGEP